MIATHNGEGHTHIKGTLEKGSDFRSVKTSVFVNKK